uniref:SRCR domain-containing protein n=1 Tax=Knipowitschia caucasica TaxID=637954 RepID=A0AAV2LK24_KNICA
MKTSLSQTLCPECDEDLCLRLCVQSVMKTSVSQTLCPECDEDLSVSDSVRLVGGSGLCSGSLQIWDQSWISVCEGALDLRGAEVLCRELGCRGPSVLQGELSSLGQTFHCEGHESALVDCPRSRPKTCPSGPSEDVICSGQNQNQSQMIQHLFGRSRMSLIPADPKS